MLLEDNTVKVSTDGYTWCNDKDLTDSVAKTGRLILNGTTSVLTWFDVLHPRNRMASELSISNKLQQNRNSVAYWENLLPTLQLFAAGKHLIEYMPVWYKEARLNPHLWQPLNDLSELPELSIEAIRVVPISALGDTQNPIQAAWDFGVTTDCSTFNSLNKAKGFSATELSTTGVLKNIVGDPWQICFSTSGVLNERGTEVLFQDGSTPRIVESRAVNKRYMPSSKIIDMKKLRRDIAFCKETVCPIVETFVATGKVYNQTPKGIRSSDILDDITGELGLALTPKQQTEIDAALAKVAKSKKALADAEAALDWIVEGDSETVQQALKKIGGKVKASSSSKDEEF